MPFSHSQLQMGGQGLEFLKQKVELPSNQTLEPTSLVSKPVLHQKLRKAMMLANNPINDKYFDIQRSQEFYTKDAMDNKHGFYFLRVGSDSDQFDLSLKVKMFLKGDQVESFEKDQKVKVYNIQGDNKVPGNDFKLTTFCEIKPQLNKKHCDFLVPTTHHDRTQIFVQKKLKVGSTIEVPITGPRDTETD